MFFFDSKINLLYTRLNNYRRIHKFTFLLLFCNFLNFIINFSYKKRKKKKQNNNYNNNNVFQSVYKKKKKQSKLN